jgi:hypothetical protein
MFIVTPSKWHSKRFRSEKPERVPSVSQIATVSPAAGLQRVQQTGQRQTTLTNLGRPEKAICFVDSCVTLTCGLLRVEGWTSQPPMSDYFSNLVNGTDPELVKRADQEISKDPLLHAIMRNTIAPVLMNAGFRGNVILEKTARQFHSVMPIPV